MKVNIEIDIDDLIEVFNEDGVVGEMKAILAEEVQKVVKRHPQYKAFIQAQAEAAIKKMMETTGV